MKLDESLFDTDLMSTLRGWAWLAKTYGPMNVVGNKRDFKAACKMANIYNTDDDPTKLDRCWIIYNNYLNTDINKLI